jgi:hypothetical protein
MDAYYSEKLDSNDFLLSPGLAPDEVFKYFNDYVS